jgi:hypothetical protein
MSVYNVAATVVSLIDADSPETAIQELRTRLENAGFVVFDTEGECAPNAFESELGVEPDPDPRHKKMLP